MAISDWYPKVLADRAIWHINFATEAATSGTSHGLIAAQVTQIGVDADNVQQLVTFAASLDEYRQAISAFRKQFLDGPLGIPVPAAPTAPTLEPLVIGSLPSIQARTRQYVGLIKASLNYNTAVGEAFGIIAPEPAPAGTPLFTATPQPSSQVLLKLKKSGFSVIGIYSMRGTGGWEQIGIATRANFTDTRPPLVAGAPEIRQYRVRGIVNDVPTGPFYPTVDAITIP